jgi:hypothetical protein
VRPLITALLVPFFAVVSFAQTPSAPAHGLWVWKTPAILAARGRTEALRDFCASQQINEVYVSFSHGGTESDRAVEEDILANVIRVLHKSHIRVEALLSSADADEPGPHRDKLLEHIGDVIRFNQAHHDSPFDGIHLDIEPQQRQENKGPNNLNYLPDLIGTFRAARSLASPAHLAINADIPNKVLRSNLDQRRNLLSSLPRFTLMLYGLNNPTDGQTAEQKQEKLRNAAKRAFEIAYQGLDDPNLATMAIALRTPDYQDLLPGMLTTADDELRANPHYLGWAWHSWNDQFPASPSQAPGP